MADLTFAEDFTSSSELDSGLLGTPSSGIYWNRGVHPLVTIDNLLSFLPNLSFTSSDFTAYSENTTYGKYEDTGAKSDIVSSDSKIYFSKTSSNVGNAVNNTTYWQETNINSLRIRNFIANAKQNMISAMLLTRKLIENQYIYNVGETLITLPNDYSGWSFEPKGSDYVKIRINQIALQANTTSQVSLYVINQGSLSSTITLNPNNGVLSFEDSGYIISGKGRFLFVFESQQVKSESAYNDPLKYDGFVCYPVSGSGSTAAGSEYSFSTIGNGLNFNITAYLDSTQYITNNLTDFSKLWQLQFTMDFFQTMLHNVNIRENENKRLLSKPLSENMLSLQTLNLEDNTIAKMYKSELKKCKDSINMTFDRFLKSKKGIKVKSFVS